MLDKSSLDVYKAKAAGAVRKGSKGSRRASLLVVPKRHAAERESLDAITEMLDLMEHKVRDDYVEASGVYWRRFLCNDAFRSSKQKKDHTVKAIPVNLHVQNLLVDSHRTQVSPLPKSTQSHDESEKKLVSQLST